MQEGVTIRELRDEDDLDALTELLHRAYAPLAAAGMRFLASHQSVEVSRHRIERGTCLVAVHNGTIVGTVVYSPPGSLDGSPFLARPDVAEFGQFAVEPSLQRTGIGAELMRKVEEMGRRDGAAWMSLNTSENAHHLIAYYQRKGYRFIEHVQWRDVNYRSVVMAKALASHAS